MKAHGVPWIIRHFNGELSLEDAAEGANMDTRRYAKRQVTWFRNQLAVLAARRAGQSRGCSHAGAGALKRAATHPRGING